MRLWSSDTVSHSGSRTAEESMTVDGDGPAPAPPLLKPLFEVACKGVSTSVDDATGDPRGLNDDEQDAAKAPSHEWKRCVTEKAAAGPKGAHVASRPEYKAAERPIRSIEDDMSGSVRN
uniref:Uncharacterized protein n=1 Tax=Odontella aurita TaxID=265563 RepID=A0A7S4IE38_9STRA|mmetsp:Transcript_23793/g.70311  ORF Transcript_23793/g.70311 Transcript_23793/m.70311 type:complete len:119 (+) Transcript_23793:370-726(+)